MPSTLCRKLIVVNDKQLLVNLKSTSFRIVNEDGHLVLSDGAAKKTIQAAPRCCASPDASSVGKRREQARPGDSLRHWVEENGGWLHPSVGIIHSKRYSCRGLGVVNEKGLVTEASTPVLIVPEKLFMTSEDAAPLLTHLLSGKRASASFERQTANVQLAVLLAYERSRLAASRWKAYIKALPSDIPTGWALSPAQLEALLPSLEKELDMERQRIQREVRVARAGVEANASAVVDQIGAVLGISKDDLIWAFGQVVSRSFGNDEVAALLPLVDLCNHGSGAYQPCEWTLGNGEPATAIYLSPEQGGVSIMTEPTQQAGASEVEKQEAAGPGVQLAGQPWVGEREICQGPQQASTAIKEKAAWQVEQPLGDIDEDDSADATANGLRKDSTSIDIEFSRGSNGFSDAGLQGVLRMEAGQELLISYNFSPYVPKMSYFLNFGFVPRVVEEQ